MIRWFLLLFLFSLMIEAHQSKENYIDVNITADHVFLHCDIETDNFQSVIDLDDNNNSVVSWKELYNHQQQIETHLLSQIHLTQNNQLITLSPSEYKIYRKLDQSYLNILLHGDVTSQETDLSLEYTLFFDIDPLQRMFLSVTTADNNITQLFSPRQTSHQLSLQKKSQWDYFLQFWEEGIWHIWSGYDHLLFVLMLIIPAVLIKKEQTVSVVSSFKTALLNLVKIITTFSIAHSITLSAAFLDLASINARWIESGIALSIFITAVFNIMKYFPHRIYLLVFLFGLLHGFGFANALSEMAMQNVHLLIILFGFNLGVETGQIAIVLLVFPLLYYFAKFHFYQTIILQGISFITALLALYWFIDRIL